MNNERGFVPRRRRPALTAQGAEALAAAALAFLADDLHRLSAFLEATGSSPDDLRASAASRDTAVATLEHLLANESELLVFTAHADTTPEAVHVALHLLQGTDAP
jgi:Protein of unknown function (DUF3572)